MPVSVAEPFGPALERTKFLLFKPFNFVKWLTLGFCAWLASLSVSIPNINDENLHREIGRFIRDNPGLALTLLGIGVVVFLAIYVVFRWLNSRGDFMFLDGLVHNRGDVAEPWRHFRPMANRLFLLRIIVELPVTWALMLVASLPLAIGSLIDLLHSPGGLRSFSPSPFTWVGLAVTALLLIVLFIVRWIFLGCLTAFVVPIMYARNLHVWPATKLFYRELFFPNLGSFVLFFLMMLVLGLGAALVIGMAVCLTCCLGYILLILPYVNAVFLLPITAFFRYYTLCFLEQFGPGYRILPDNLPPPPGGFPITPNAPDWPPPGGPTPTSSPW